MCLLFLPVELREIIISYIDDIETLFVLNISSQEISDLSNRKIHEHFLKNTLNEAFRKSHQNIQKLRETILVWKNKIFDKIPLGDLRRKIVAHAFYFLSGKYNIFLYQVFDYHIQNSDFYDDFYFGKLYNEKLFYAVSPKIINIEKLRRLLNKDNSIYKEKLFEELVGIKDFRIKSLAKLSLYEKQHLNSNRMSKRKKSVSLVR